MIHDLTHLHREADSDEDHFWVLHTNAGRYLVTEASGTAIMVLTSQQHAFSNEVVRFIDTSGGVTLIAVSAIQGLNDSTPEIRRHARAHDKRMEEEAKEQAPEWLP